MNEQNDEVIDVTVLDTGTGIREDTYKSEKIILESLNVLSLQKNLNLKELKIGLPVSEKIVGKLGPFEKINIDKNSVKFQIYKEYQGIMQNKDCFQSRQKHKSMFTSNRYALNEGDIDVDDLNDEYNDDRNKISYAVQKKQITDRNEIRLSGRHQEYLNSSN